MSDAGDRLADAAVRAHNAVVELGAAYKIMVDARHEFARQAYRDGGQHGAEDIAVRAGRDAIDTELVGMLVGCGLGQVLVQSGGRADATPVRDFGQRWMRRVASEALTTTGGKPPETLAPPFGKVITAKGQHPV